MLLPTNTPVTKLEAEEWLKYHRMTCTQTFIGWAGAAFMGAVFTTAGIQTQGESIAIAGVVLLGIIGSGLAYTYGRQRERHEVFAALTRTIRNAK